MYKATFNMEAVTPIFMYGNGKNAELRSPSIKGLLRWWFRAIMGGFLSLNEIRRKEDIVFGSTSNKSGINVRIETYCRPENISAPSSLRYLWFSIFMQQKKGIHTTCFPAKKTHFKVTFTALEEGNFWLGLGSWWALVNLGGIGARSRRGAGSIRVLSVESQLRFPFDFVFKGSDIASAKKFIETNLKKVFSTFRTYAPKDKRMNMEEVPIYAVLSKNTSRISLVGQKSGLFHKWNDALSAINDVYKSFRKKPIGKRNRHLFGLPILRTRFAGLRQSSPLLIGVTQIGNAYAARLVKFYTSIHENFTNNIGTLKIILDKFDDDLVRSNKLSEFIIII